MASSIGTEETLRGLETVLHRGLAKTPESRYASCAELGEEVARVLDAARGSTRPISVDLERVPLSSRSVTGRSLSDQLLTDPLARPSILARKKTQRFQNIAAGLAVVVIIALAFLGRRSPSAPPAEPATASASAPISVASAAQQQQPATHVRPRPHPSHATSASAAPASASAVLEDAAAPVPPPPVDNDD